MVSLWPMFFLIYVSDNVNIVLSAKAELFADDFGLFVSHENIVTLSDKANCDISLLCQWFLANKLSVDKTKTSEIKAQ